MAKATKSTKRAHLLGSRSRSRTGGVSTQASPLGGANETAAGSAGSRQQAESIDGQLDPGPRTKLLSALMEQKEGRSSPAERPHIQMSSPSVVSFLRQHGSLGFAHAISRPEMSLALLAQLEFRLWSNA